MEDVKMKHPGLLYAAVATLVLLLVSIPCQKDWDTAPVQWMPEYYSEPLSSYDDLIREMADSTGWGDWRLLASVVYHESRFHNEARSHRGAVGLMQIRSERYTEEMLLDPRTNLRVGARYLKRLENMFPAASPVEAVKFALAAYNLGEGKVLQLVKATEAAGEDASRWDEVAKRLPEGHHTVRYVENVLDTYAVYAKRYPL